MSSLNYSLLSSFLLCLVSVTFLNQSHSFSVSPSFSPVTMGQGAYLLLSSPLYFCELLLYGKEQDPNDTAPQILPCNFML